MHSVRNVLLTGSRGFTGRHLRTALERAGYKVVGLVRDNAGKDEILADVADERSIAQAVARVDPAFVIHLAGVASVVQPDPLEFYRVNVLGTLALLKGITASGVRPEKIVLASSSGVYGVSSSGLLDESCIPAPINHYATSKLAMEHMAANYREQLPLIIARPFNYTGAGQTETYLIPKILGHFRRKEPTLTLGNLQVAREFNDVRMVAHAYLSLLHAAAGTTVNICTGISHRLLDVVELASHLTGHKLTIEVDPNLVRANEIPLLAGNPALFHSLVRDAPTYTLEETMRWMLS